LIGYYLEKKVEGVKCKDIHPDDPTFCLTGWCNPGYQGNMCAECEDGFAQNSEAEKTCSVCVGNTNYYLKAVGISIAAIVFIIWTIRNSLRKQNKESKNPEPEGNAHNYEKISLKDG
jgi:hypothetical protein